MAGALVHRAQEPIKPRVCGWVHGLHARRIINLCYSWDIAPRNIEFVYTLERLMLRGHSDAVPARPAACMGYRNRDRNI
jgi:hypothetical protein